MEKNNTQTVSLQQEIEQLRAENAKLKAATESGLGMKVTAKGGLSVYGLGRFPLTLYKGQWENLFDRIPAIQAFMKANEDKLTVREKTDDKAPVTEEEAA